MRILVGVDGSASSTRAVEWCAAHAKALEADVVAVFAREIPIYAGAEAGFGFAPIPAPLPTLSDAERTELRDTIRDSWCSPLARAGVPYRVEVIESTPAAGIIAVAANEAADLVVAGRRGRGGFAELLLGSTTHHLSHHLDRPLVIVP